MKKLTIQDKLGLSRYKRQKVSHIRIDEDICNNKCEEKLCMVICPAQSYEEDHEGRIILNHDNCLECGSCRIICPEHNIEWDYPNWGRGIIYRHG